MSVIAEEILALKIEQTRGSTKATPTVHLAWAWLVLLQCYSCISNSSERFFCKHCDCVLSKTQFYKHKKLYYDKNRHGWEKNLIIPEYKQDFDFDDDLDSRVEDFPFSLDSDGDLQLIRVGLNKNLISAIVKLKLTEATILSIKESLA